ncbi:hypothetical protein Peur_046892 [Populus x canadensis]
MGCVELGISVAVKFHEEMLSGNGKFGIYCKPNLVCYGSIIDGLCKDGLAEKAKELFLEMKGRAICPDVVLYSLLMHGLCSMDEWEEAKDMLCQSWKMKESSELFELMAQRGIEPDGFTYSTLIDGYCLSEGRSSYAPLQGMLDEGTRPTIIIYNIYPGGSFQAWKLETAWDLFYRMSNEGLKPTVVTYSIMIHGLCKEAKWKR